MRGFLRLFLLFLAFLTIGCTGSADPTAPPGNSGGPGAAASGGSVSGFVVQVNPVFFVADPAQAPPGASPLEGAEVRVVDRFGNVVDRTTTAADGSFLVADLPLGLLRAEVRVDPQAAEASAQQEFSSFPGASYVLGRQYGVSREDAVAAVTAGLGSQVRVLGTALPLPVGTRIAPAYSDAGEEADALRQTEAEEWLFLVDPTPLALYSHPVEYVLVDAESARQTRLPARWFPALNGAIYWPTETSYSVGDGQPSSELVRPGDPVVPREPRPRPSCRPATIPIPRASSPCWCRAGTKRASRPTSRTSRPSCWAAGFRHRTSASPRPSTTRGCRPGRSAGRNCAVTWPT